MPELPLPPGVDERVLDALRRSIRDRCLVEFRYHGRRRVVLPMRLGRDHRGVWMLRALQVNGSSSSGLVAPDVPKLFRAAEMTGVRVLSRRFAVPMAYERRDGVLVEVDIEL